MLALTDADSVRMRSLREIDWNWRDFGWQEWVFGGGFVLWVAFLPLLPVLLRGAEMFLVVFESFLAVNQLFLTGAMFVLHNRRRRGLPVGQYEEHPGRPISIRAVRLILVLGFVGVAGLLLLLIWLGNLLV